MTKIIATVLTLFSSFAFANTQTLECSSGKRYEKVTVILDDANFKPGSNFFNIRKAAIRDNYATAELTCAGHTLENITCIGFWFNDSEHIVEVKIQNTENGLVANYSPLKGMEMSNGPWQCQLKN